MGELIHFDPIAARVRTLAATRPPASGHEAEVDRMVDEVILVTARKLGYTPDDLTRKWDALRRHAIRAIFQGLLAD